MNERPTPRTASAMMEIPSKFDSIWVVPAEGACDLEHELGDALRERDEARRVLRKFLKEVLQLIDSQDWKSFMESRETARRLLEGWE